jgi:ABC-2 type transport system permease protein
VASLIAYGVANTAFGGLAIMLVVRRESGILKRIRSTPLPAPVYLAAALSSVFVVFVLQSATILIVGKLAYDAAWPSDWLSWRSPSCSAPRASPDGPRSGLADPLRGRCRGRGQRDRAAMTFLSGGFGPTRDFPDFLQAIADVLPLTYFVRIITGIFIDDEAIWTKPGAIAVLLAWGALGAGIAARRFTWEPVQG